MLWFHIHPWFKFHFLYQYHYHTLPEPKNWNIKIYNFDPSTLLETNYFKYERPVNISLFYLWYMKADTWYLECCKFTLISLHKNA